MEPFVHLDAIALPLPRPNVDTDQVIPARYLQKPRSDDFGAWLFHDVRRRKDGSPVADFPLNVPAYAGARVIVAERNFGCGSSREQAVWALHDYGFRAAIAPSFGDIFAGNAQKNGLLPVVLPEAAVAALLAQLAAHPGAHVQVDLSAQHVTFPDGARHPFAVDPFVKACLLDGVDEIAYTLTHLAAIEAFETRATTSDGTPS